MSECVTFGWLTWLLLRLIFYVDFIQSYASKKWCLKSVNLIVLKFKVYYFSKRTLTDFRHYFVFAEILISNIKSQSLPKIIQKMTHSDKKYVFFPNRSCGNWSDNYLITLVGMHLWHMILKSLLHFSIIAYCVKFSAFD